MPRLSKAVPDRMLFFFQYIMEQVLLQQKAGSMRVILLSDKNLRFSQAGTAIGRCPFLDFRDRKTEMNLRKIFISV